MALGLTALQRDLLLTLQEYEDQGGVVPPSYREIANELDLHISCVHRLVVALERRGYVERCFHKHRSLKVIQRIPVPPEDPVEVTAAGAEAIALGSVA